MAQEPQGLTSAEARRLLAQAGPNSVATAAPRLRHRLLERFSGPVPWLLEAAILLQFILGEYAEAAVIALLLLFNAALGLVQEGRAQRTLAALESRLALLASVRRDGQWQILPASTLVPGDLVQLSLGGIVPADVRLQAGAVLLDQSTLTGESLPVERGPGADAFAGAVVRRGQATALVTATGTGTRFGRTARLVGVARAASARQQAVFRIVGNLALFSAVVVVVQVAYAVATHLLPLQIVPLALTAVLAAVPVALPATFTLASALAARKLAAGGVLPTRLAAIDDAASLDVLCSDKTGTLTRNELGVTAVQPAAGQERDRVLLLAALASADGGLDPVDNAVRGAARQLRRPLPPRSAFEPFDPARKTAAATVVEDGREIRVVKGALGSIDTGAPPPADLQQACEALQRQGQRVLAVAAGPPGRLAFVGLIALSDPPRDDARGVIEGLAALGVSTVMITGDAPATAATIARAVGLPGPVHAAGALPPRLQPGDYAVYAGVFPEDKFNIVRALQASGHTVGMCGDGVNDAPALRQAQMGVAVASATDVAKSAAGLVLTRPGLDGVLQAIRCGRESYQRLLTYTFRSVGAKVNQMLLLTAGLLLTGHAVMTPMLMVIVMISGDFLAMSATTDRVRLSPRPDVWRIGAVTAVAVALGLCAAAFGTLALEFGRSRLGLDQRTLRTLAAVVLVCSSQALFYAVRERRRLWSSRPGAWVVLSTVADVALIGLLAGTGTLMAPLAWPLIGATVAACLALALLLDGVKGLLFRALRLA